MALTLDKVRFHVYIDICLYWSYKPSIIATSVLAEILTFILVVYITDTVMVAPVPVSGQVSPGGKSITINMDMPEQKQWWQLEEVM